MKINSLIELEENAQGNVKLVSRKRAPTYVEKIFLGVESYSNKEYIEPQMEAEQDEGPGRNRSASYLPGLKCSFVYVVIYTSIYMYTQRCMSMLRLYSYMMYVCMYVYLDICIFQYVGGEYFEQVHKQPVLSARERAETRGICYICLSIW